MASPALAFPALSVVKGSSFSPTGTVTLERTLSPGRGAKLKFLFDDCIAANTSS